ncbi:BgTH12-04481 [Blumeria graminis f. sp. triticale]|uniref:BgTH12-04481 n=1 Tax=Blumeria graminis f. sp. triticale TaxID=1689686 RepID=A0A9W4CUL3_BLUGR|nr:BgTH12-04481 [Blumeria graminis f. sp. triticale]
MTAVPSKSALRALRNLALGTSFSLAFALGITLEERRRLIHTAQRIQKNTQKIRSIKRYTTSGINVIKAFEERILNHQTEFSDDSNQPELTEIETDLPANGSQKEAVSRGLHLFSPVRNEYSKPYRTTMKIYSTGLNLKKPWKTYPDTLGPASANDEKNSPCQALAETKVLSLINLNPPQLDTAEVYFVDMFSEYLKNRTLHPKNMMYRIFDLALILFRAYKRENMVECSLRVFSFVIKQSIEAEIIPSFQAEIIIQRLLKQESHVNMQNAVCVYLSTVDRASECSTPQLLSLGHILCRKSYANKEYQSSCEIFNRLKLHSHEFPVQSLDVYLMAVLNQSGNNPEVFDYFLRFCNQDIHPGVQRTKHLFREVFNYLLINQRLNEAEEAIKRFSILSKKSRQFRAVSISCRSLLEKDWEIFHDLDRTTRLFYRIEEYIACNSFPWVSCEVMIRICLEVEEITLAKSFYERSLQRYGKKLESLYAQITLLKAQKNDWLGVRDDFKKIEVKSIADAYSNFFPTILKLFSSSNSTASTKDFIQLALCMGVRLNTNAMNKIAEIFIMDKEYEAVIRLLKYMTERGHAINSIFMDVMLRQLYKTSRFTIDHLLQLLESIAKLDRPGRLIDIETFMYFRRIILSSGRAPESWRYKSLEKLNQIFRPHELEPRDPFHPKRILGEMVLALKMNDPRETVAIYNCARSNNVQLGFDHLNVAVEASFRYSEGNVEESMRMIHSSGLPESQTSPSVALLYVHQLQQIAESGNKNARELIEMTMQFVSAFEKRGLKVPLQVVTQTVSSLEKIKEYSAVSDFWDLVSKRMDLTQSGLTLETLTVFLNTCIRLRSTRFFWQILHYMALNRITPDHHFHLLLGNSRRRIAKNVAHQRVSPKDAQFLDTLVEGSQHVNKLRSQNRIGRNLLKENLIQKIKSDFRILPQTSNGSQTNQNSDLKARCKAY